MRTRQIGYWLPLVVVAAAAYGEGRAEAQASLIFGHPGSLAITGEDMLGYFSEHQGYKDQNNRDYTATSNQFSFAFRSGAKIGVHYFVIPSLSVGGTLGFESRGGSDAYQDIGGDYTVPKTASTTFILQPKVGYALMFTPVVGIWFRGGPGVRHDSAANVTKDTTWTVGADALFVVTPVPHFGFFIGPTGEVAFAGTHTQLSVPPDTLGYSHSESYNRLGATTGLIGYF